MSKNIKYRAYAYYRLSKDDGDGAREESNSITNQRNLISEFIKRQDDITLVGEQFDDGYTGTNFDRPGFQKMMTDIENGVANCIIVKDLSRLGRDYINTGKYMQVIFPQMKIRFIAINDAIDSLTKSHTDELLIPFKNLMNDNHCRELSNKLRNQLRLQRANGEFMGSYVFYGYIKDENDKHKIKIDEDVAPIIRQIFNWFLEGYSRSKIANMLNELGFPSPLEYKRQNGSNIKSGFETNVSPQWGHKTIERILNNRIYIGVLEQGKRSSPNYKVKKVMENDISEWSIVENNHDAIIDKLIFNTVQKLMKRDTRLSLDIGKASTLSGLIFCGDCKSPMHKKTVPRKGKKFYYYVCSKYKKGAGCTPHNSSVLNIDKKILSAVNAQIKAVVELKELSNSVGATNIQICKANRVKKLINEKRLEIEEKKNYRMKLYESMIDGIISQKDYEEIKACYTELIDNLENNLKNLEIELDNTFESIETDNSWMDMFFSYGNLNELTREITTRLIDKVNVFDNDKIEIVFNFKNEYLELMSIVESEIREVV